MKHKNEVFPNEVSPNIPIVGSVFASPPPPAPLVTPEPPEPPVIQAPPTVAILSSAHEPLPPTPEEIARMAGMKGKLLASASRNVVLKRGEAAVHAIFFVTASGEKYRVIDKEAVCLKGHGTKV